MISEAVISKWGNSVSVRIPSFMQKELDLHIDEKVELLLRDNAIIIKKQRKARSLSEIVRGKSGLTIDEYAKQNPYDNSDYIEFERVGSEEI